MALLHNSLGLCRPRALAHVVTHIFYFALSGLGFVGLSLPRVALAKNVRLPWAIILSHFVARLLFYITCFLPNKGPKARHFIAQLKRAFFASAGLGRMSPDIQSPEGAI